MRHSNPDRLRALLFFLAAVLLFGAIVLLKRGTGTRLPAAASDTVAPAAVARPDTSVTAEVKDIIAAPDTVAAAPADSIGRDRRPADEAGAEDGYWDGYHDGIARREPDDGDVSSRFPTARERAAYAENYTENYHRGYREGRRGEPSPSPDAAAGER